MISNACFFFRFLKGEYYQQQQQQPRYNDFVMLQNNMNDPNLMQQAQQPPMPPLPPQSQPHLSQHQDLAYLTTATGPAQDDLTEMHYSNMRQQQQSNYSNNSNGGMLVNMNSAMVNGNELTEPVW